MKNKTGILIRSNGTTYIGGINSFMWLKREKTTLDNLKKIVLDTTDNKQVDENNKGISQKLKETIAVLTGQKVSLGCC